MGRYVAELAGTRIQLVGQAGLLGAASLRSMAATHEARPMARKKKKRRSSHLLEEVLSGRVTPSMEQLFDLIHEVNPSVVTLSGEDREELYEIKSSLQNRLIEEYGDQLVAEFGSEEDRDLARRGDAYPTMVLGLAHRSYAKDACHAIFKTLSRSARDWVVAQARRAESHGVLDQVSAELKESETSKASKAAQDSGDKKERKKGKSGGQSRQPGPGQQESRRELSEGVERGWGADASLKRAKELKDAYEWDLAKQWYEVALEEPDALASEQKRILVARALLRFLVEDAVEDPEALLLRTQLPEEMLQDEELRSLWAESAARTGDGALARRLLRGIDGEQAEQAKIVLAQAALNAGQLSECGQWLEEIPIHCEQASLRQQIANGLAARRAAEAERLAADLAQVLARLEACEGPEASEAAAAIPADFESRIDAVLELDANNAVGRRARKFLRERAARAAQQGLGLELQRAIELRNVERAQSLLAELAEHGGVPEGLEAQLDALVAELARERQAAEADALRAILAQEPDARSLSEWWDRHSEQAEEVWAELGPELPLWRWALAFGPSKGLGRCGRVIEAARLCSSLEKALAQAREEDPEEAAGSATAVEQTLACLEASELSLPNEEPFAALLGAARRAVAERRSRVARAAWGALRDAASAWPDARAEDAWLRLRELAERVPCEALPPEEQPEAEALIERVRRGARQAGLWRKIDEERQAQRYFAARGYLQELREELGEELGEELLRQLEEHSITITEEIQSAWIEDEGAGPEIELDCEDRGGELFGIDPSCGDLLHFRQILGRCFVRILSVEGTSRGFVLRSPEPFHVIGAGSGEPGELVLVAREGRLRAALGHGDSPIELRDFHKWTRAVDFAKSSWGFLRHDEGVIWAISRDGDVPKVAVLDSEQGKLLHEAMPFDTFAPLRDACFGFVQNRNDWQIRSSHGKKIAMQREQQIVESIAMHPGGEHYVVVRYRPRPAHEGVGGGREILTLSRDGEVLARYRLDEVQQMPLLGFRGSCADDPDVGLLFVWAEGQEQRPVLRALRAQGDASEGRWMQLWELTVTQKTMLLPQPGGGALFLSNDGEEQRFHRLGEKAPRLLKDVPSPEDLPAFALEQPCNWLGDKLQRVQRPFRGVLPMCDNAAATRGVLRFLQAGASADELVALLGCKLTRAAEAACFAALEGRAGTDPAARLRLAERALQEGKFELCLEELERGQLVPEQGFGRLEEKGAEHAAHVGMLARLARGELEEAEDLGDGVVRTDAESCPVGTLTEFARALQLPLSKHAAVENLPKGATMLSFVLRLRLADAAWDAGDPQRVIQLLEHAVIWAQWQPSAAGRLARAYLAKEPRPRAGLFRMRLVLAMFLDRLSMPELPREDLSVLSLDREEFLEIAESAAQWLGGEAEAELCRRLRSASGKSAQREEDPLYPSPGAMAPPRTLNARKEAEPPRLLSQRVGMALFRRVEPELKRKLRATGGVYVGRQRMGIAYAREAEHGELWARVARAFAPEHLRSREDEDFALLAISHHAVFDLLADSPAFLHMVEEDYAQMRRTDERGALIVHPDGFFWGRLQV
jgi:hypothetical protein